MKKEKVIQLGVGLGIIIAGLLAVIFFGIYYYFPKVDQRLDALASKVNSTTTTPTISDDTKLTPRLAELEKNYATLVSVINTKMPNVNLAALLSITAAKNTPAPNIALAISLIENEPKQAKIYLTQALSFNDNEVTAVMGPMDKYEGKSRFLNHFKIFHHS
jgi:hypothetical protein